MKAKQKTKIEIIGAGRVGSATGKVFTKKGFFVRYIDTNKALIKRLKRQKINIGPPTKDANQTDISFICVPTPNKNKQIDLNYIKQSCQNLALSLKQKRKYHLVVVKSTAVPGTANNFVIPLIEKYSNKKAGKDFGVCVNPEYLRDKTAQKDAFYPRVIIIGQLDKKSGSTLKNIYTDFACPVHILSLNEAELHKYIHNIYNANKIAFFNEMRIIARNINIKDKEIDRLFQLIMISSEAMYNPNYGIKNLGAYKGKCLPKDIEAFLSWVKMFTNQSTIISSIQKQNQLLTKKTKV